MGTAWFRQVDEVLGLKDHSPHSQLGSQKEATGTLGHLFPGCKGIYVFACPHPSVECRALTVCEMQLCNVDTSSPPRGFHDTRASQ